MPKCIINVASQITENVNKPFGPYYRHYFRIELDETQERVREILADIKSKYPDPQFSVTCTKWETVGTSFE